MVKDIILEALVGDTTKSQRVAIWRVMILGIFIFHITWAGGWIPGYDTGFVEASDFVTLQGDVQRIEENQMYQKSRDLVESIERSQERVCKAISEHNTDAVRYASQQRDESRREYQDLMGRDISLPTCSELGY